MTNSRETHCSRPAESSSAARIGRSPREGGIALFVVLVVVVVLSIVIFQLTYTTKIEESIAENRKGFLELSYSLQSIARDVLVRLHDDWSQDIDGESAEEPAATGGTGTGGPAGAPPGLGPGAGAGAGDAASGTTSEAAVAVDTRHEDSWAHPYQQSINGADVEVRILDGEGRFDLNQLFWYVVIDEEDNPSTTAVGTDDPGGAGAGLDPAAPDDSDEDTDENNDDEFEEDEEPVPSDERIEMTKLMLARLIEAVVNQNEEYGFYYEEEDLDSPDLIAEEIVQMLLEEEKDEFLRVDALRLVTQRELYYGPADPRDEEEDEEEDFEDDFGDDRRSSGYRGFGDEFGAEGEFGLGGLDGLDESSGYRESEFGVEDVERPLGLREFFTAHATTQEEKAGTNRKWPAINLNTCRPETLMALMVVSFEDFDEAYDVAHQINEYLNSFPAEEEEDGTTQPVETESDVSTDGEEEAPQELSFFTQLSDLQQVNEEEWVSDVDTLQGEEESIYDRLEHDLKGVAVFKSTYFTATLEGNRDDRPLQGELVVKREEKDDRKWIRVIYWRESFKKLKQ